jgi:hypothetical protein
MLPLILDLIAGRYSAQVAAAQSNASVAAQKIAFTRPLPAGVRSLLPKGGKNYFWGKLRLKVDYVGYSSYDTMHSREALQGALDYVQGKLKPKGSIAGKRVFLDEYGHPLEQAKTPQEQDRRSRVTLRAALEWGCRFALYWQMYCNEVVDGKYRGFWLVDDKNQKQPVFHTHQKLLAQSRVWVEEFARLQKRLPTHEEFCRQAVRILDALPAA